MTTALRRALVAIASARLALGLAGYAVLVANHGQGPAAAWLGSRSLALFVGNAVVYALAAVFLFVGGRDDPRAQHLATFFLLVAATYSGEPVQSLFPLIPSGLAPLLGAPGKLALDAFLPLFLWLFVREFPEAPFAGSPRRALRWPIGAAAGVGAFLFLANLLLIFVPEFSRGSGLVSRIACTFDRSKAISAYYGPLALLMIAALAFMAWKGRTARREERRRVGLFLFSLVLGLAPVFVELALEAVSSRYAEWSDTPVGWEILAIFIYTGLLSVPFTTTYSVLVHRVLDVRVILRKALQYALARTTLALAAAAPFLALSANIYAHRTETITGFLSGWRPALLLLAAACGILALVSRRRLLESVDRRFFRESFDAQKILVQLVQRSRGATDAVDLAALLTSEIDRALHLDSIALLALDSTTSMLAAPDGVVRPLDASSRLAAMIASGADPLPVDLESPRSPLAQLPLEDRLWILDGGFRLLVPMIGAEGMLVGVIALGEKKSELPFQSEDRLLLSAVAASGALALENRLLRASSSRSPAIQSDGSDAAVAGGPAADDAARECRFCLSVHVSRTTVCDTCGGPLAAAPIPYILSGKFRFDRRIGAGGMGVVYRALDLTLGRSVAIKTLPRISPENAMRLRREARAAAAVSHPNLALIFGAESWRGTPMLVFEYLEGGTLLDRLGRSPLSTREAIALGLSLAGALERAHGAGVLHRDIKPSNIGYAADGTPKLLDFGLARILDGRDGRRRERPAVTRMASETSRQDTLEMESYSIINTVTDQVVGTPSYLSPEAVIGEHPDATFDLWALAIVLYESLAGRNPMSGGPPVEVMKRIRHSPLPDPLITIASCSPPLADFLREALARDPARRPATAPEFRTRLESLALSIAA